MQAKFFSKFIRFYLKSCCNLKICCLLFQNIVSNFRKHHALIWIDLVLICKFYKRNWKQKMENSLNKKRGRQPNWADPGAQQEQPSNPRSSPLLFSFVFSLMGGPRMSSPISSQETIYNTSQYRNEILRFWLIPCPLPKSSTPIYTRRSPLFVTFWNPKISAAS
jgi:hypothetical protein